MFKTKTNWLKRGLAMLMAVVMAFSVNVSNTFASDEVVSEQCATPVITTTNLVLSLEGYIISGGIRGNSDNDSTCTYYYTLDGTEPSETNGTKITGANTAKNSKTIISATKLLNAVADGNGVATLKMVAVKAGYSNSEILEYKFKLQTENMVAFTDVNLKTSILKALGKENADVSIPVTKTEMESLTELDLRLC